MHPEHVDRHFRAYLWLLLAIVVFLCAFSFAYLHAGIRTVQAPIRTDIPAGFPQDAPAPTPADAVDAQHGFQYLVSYTGSAFMPVDLTVNQGETVRFTNNGDTAIQLSVDGAESPPLAHGEYWEHAFSESGVSTIQLGPSAVTITVQ